MKTDACSVRNGILTVRHHAGAICALSLVVLFGLAGCKVGGAFSSLGGGESKGMYMELENHPGCTVWNTNPKPDETVSWSGVCVDGKPDGKGEVVWHIREDGRLRTSKEEGSFVNGKRDGRWKGRSRGVDWEGFFVADKPSGHWVFRYPNGKISTGSYSNGKRRGDWVDRFAEGSALEGRICRIGEEGYACWMAVENRPGCYYWNSNLLSSEANPLWSGECADGKPDGKGVLSWRFRKNGKLLTNTDEGVFVDGKRRGHWVMRFHPGRDMKIAEGPYVDGKRNGIWVYRWKSGRVDKGPYVDGKRNGIWVIDDGAGIINEGSYVDDHADGSWIMRDTRDPDNVRFETVFKRGKVVTAQRQISGPAIQTSTRSTSSSTGGAFEGIMTGILRGIQATAPAMQNMNAAIQLQRQQQAERRAAQARRQAEQARAQQQQYEQQQAQAAQQQAEAERQQQRQAEEAQREAERQQAEAERQQREAQKLAEKQAKDAKRQACINRISGTRNHCVRRGKWVGGSAGWRIHNKCGEPIAVLIDHRDGRGFANLGHIKPYGFMNTSWRDEEGKKKGLAYQACYHSGGIFVKPTGCEVKSWACVEGSTDNP